MKHKIRNLKGWARTKVSRSRIYRPESLAELREVLARGYALPRGGGMSFGDVALNHKGNVIELKDLRNSEPIRLNSRDGTLSCPAHLTQAAVLRTVVPSGWILPAIPGSDRITIGGAVAADAHGKNHHLYDSISHHLISLELMLAQGDLVEVSRDNMSDLFWATVGGLGLTGIILRVNLKLQKLTSCYMLEEMIGFNSVDEMIDLFETNKTNRDYLLGRVDGNFRPGMRWSGALSVGVNASSDGINEPWIVPSRRKIYLPFPNPLPKGGVLASRIVNSAIGYRFKPGRKQIKDVNRFFFPQDSIRNWNLAFGWSGFVDYQCCVPISQARLFVESVHTFLNSHSVLCFLVAIKRFRCPENTSPLVFPQDGLSVALDIPIQPATMEMLDQLDDIVETYNGRVNLVKDSRLPRKRFKNMYPDYETWRLMKEKYDPKGIFVSDLSRRLGLTE